MRADCRKRWSLEVRRGGDDDAALWRGCTVAGGGVSHCRKQPGHVPCTPSRNPFYVTGFSVFSNKIFKVQNSCLGLAFGVVLLLSAVHLFKHSQGASLLPCHDTGPPSTKRLTRSRRRGQCNTKVSVIQKWNLLVLCCDMLPCLVRCQSMSPGFSGEYTCAPHHPTRPMPYRPYIGKVFA